MYKDNDEESRGTDILGNPMHIAMVDAASDLQNENEAQKEEIRAKDEEIKAAKEEIKRLRVRVRSEDAHNINI